MRKKFINIEKIEILNKSIFTKSFKRDIKKPKSHLILDGYNTSDKSEKIKLNAQQEQFKNSGYALELDPISEIPDYRFARNRKLAIWIFVIIITISLLMYMISELIFQQFIKDRYSYLLYVAIGLIICFLIYSTLKIIIINANSKFEDIAIDKQLEYTKPVIKSEDKNTQIILDSLFKANSLEKPTFVSKSIAEYYRESKPVKFDIQKLHELYEEFCNKYAPEVNQELFEQFEIILAKQYIPEDTRGKCMELLRAWKLDEGDVEIANQIILQIFKHTNSYEQYTSVLDFIKHKIFGIKIDEEKNDEDVPSSLYLTKIEALKSAEHTRL
jgi:hypothetical protein